MKKIKVLQITHDLNVGGLQKLVVNIALNIDKDKFDVAVCCLRELGPLAEVLQSNGIPVYEISQQVNGKTNYLSFLDVYKLLKKLRVDIVHTHNTNPFIDGGLAAILARTKVRVHTDHARQYPDKKRYMIAEKILSGFYDEIIAVSEQTKSDLVKYEKINPSKIKVIQNGVVVQTSIRNSSKRKKDGKFIIGTVGRLCEAKGYEYLIKAMKLLLNHVNNFELQIVGDGELMPVLQGMVNSMDLQSHVSFLGECHNTDILYEGFDLFVISSIREGLPLVLLEAMAYRTPIVTTRVGGIPNVVTDNITAMLVPPRDENALAEKIWYAMNNSLCLKAFSDKAFILFEQSYSLNTMIQKYEEIYLNNTHQVLS